MLWNHECGDDDPLAYPSFLDPNSPSSNFETIGRRPFMFFTQFNYGYNSGGCWMAHNRDLMRIGVEFNKPPDCSNVVAKPDVLPSMNRRFFPVTVSGATEPDGEPMTTTILSVTQTHPVKGPGDATAPDAQRASDPRQVLLRAEYGPSGRARLPRQREDDRLQGRLVHHYREGLDPARGRRAFGGVRLLQGPLGIGSVPPRAAFRRD